MLQHDSRAWLTTPVGVLAVCLLLVELIAGMQTFVTGTITPLMAADLDAQHLYGVVTAAIQVSVFLTMPLGAALMSRWSAATLLVRLTPVVVVGGVVSALAPSIQVFVAGRILAGLAGGALMTVSLAALVTVLPGRWRRMVLAGYSATWVVAALVGPAYAGWLAETAGWRWAMVGYLPVLLAVRLVIARQLTLLDPPRQERPMRLGLGAAVALALGVAMTSAFYQVSPLTLLIAGVGVAVALLATSRILPAGVFRLAPGRPSAIALLGVLTAVYFGAQAVVAIVAHDLLGRRPAELALLLALGVLPWAVLGLVCGRWQVASTRGLRWRIDSGIALIAVGIATMAAGLAVVGPTAPAAWASLLLGWMTAGAGMGLCYLDTLDLVLAPAAEDGAAAAEWARAAVIGEAVPSALFATLCATTVAAALSGASEPARVVGVMLALLAVLSLTMVPLQRRAVRVG